MSAIADGEIEVFVPGRLCILGEHSDWAGQYRAVNPDVAAGVCVVCATNEGLFARVRPHIPGQLRYDHYDESSGTAKSVMIDLQHQDVRALLKKASS